MANKTIKDYPESTSPSGEWYVLVDDGTGCYYKVKLKNLPGGGFTTTSSTTTAAGTTSTTTTRLTTSTTTTAASTTTTTSSTTSSTSSSTTSTTTTIAYDPDVQAFMLATGIPNNSTIYFEGTPQQITGAGLWGAMNTFVYSLKNGPNAMWSKLKAIYPFIGGTATTHKFNLKDPRDLDVAFRIVFNGGVTHSANGVVFNGTTGYGDTKFAIENFTANNNLSYGTYMRTQDGTGINIGVRKFSSPTMYNYEGGQRFYYNANVWIIWPWVSGPYGLISGGINGTATSVYRNGALGGSGTTPNDAIPGTGVYWYIGAANNGTNAPDSFAINQYAFAYLGDSLNSSEMASLYNAVQVYQTTLNRQV